MTQGSNETKGKKKGTQKSSAKQPRFIVLNNAQQKMMPYDIASQHTMGAHYPPVVPMHGGGHQMPIHGGYDGISIVGGAMVPVSSAMPQHFHGVPPSYGQQMPPYACQICEAQSNRDPVSWSRLLDHIINLFVMPFEGMLRCATTGFKVCLSSCDTLGRVTENAMQGCNAFCEKGLIQCERGINRKLAPHHGSHGCHLHGDASLKPVGQHPHGGAMLGVPYPPPIMGMQHALPPQYMQHPHPYPAYGMIG